MFPDNIFPPKLFMYHLGMVSCNFCFLFFPKTFAGSADKTVKFWDLETFELIGSSGPEV